MVTVMVRVSRVIAKFHYTGPTGPDQTKSADFVRENINTYFFQTKCTEAILSNGTRKLLRLEISKMLIAVYGKQN